MSTQARAPRSDDPIEVTPTGWPPYTPSFRFVAADRTVAVLYWDDDPRSCAEYDDPAGWTWISADDPEHHQRLAADLSLSEEGAIDEVARRIWQRRDEGHGLLGFEELSPTRLPWPSRRRRMSTGRRRPAHRK
jgi:hypothetical protein